jgi:hypothetical protein
MRPPRQAGSWSLGAVMRGGTGRRVRCRWPELGQIYAYLFGCTSGRVLVGVRRAPGSAAMWCAGLPRSGWAAPWPDEGADSQWERASCLTRLALARQSHPRHAVLLACRMLCSWCVVITGAGGCSASVFRHRRQNRELSVRCVPDVSLRPQNRPALTAVAEPDLLHPQRACHSPAPQDHAHAARHARSGHGKLGSARHQQRHAD